MNIFAPYPSNKRVTAQITIHPEEDETWSLRLKFTDGLECRIVDFPNEDAVYASAFRSGETGIAAMKILIACECSGVVRDAFAALGHDAWSCDLLPSKRPGQHIQGDAISALSLKSWDIAIAHPPCDFLTNSAAWAYPDPDLERFPGVGYHQKLQLGTLTGAARREARERAKHFFLALWRSEIPRICIENPIGCMNTHPELPSELPGRQIIQPHQFGEDASKATCLWLKGFPPLVPTGTFPPRIVTHKGKQVRRWSNQTDSGQNRISPSDDRSSVRAVTYQGIANAMAAQWGTL